MSARFNSPAWSQASRPAIDSSVTASARTILPIGELTCRNTPMTTRQLYSNLHQSFLHFSTIASPTSRLPTLPFRQWFSFFSRSPSFSRAHLPFSNPFAVGLFFLTRPSCRPYRLQQSFSFMLPSLSFLQQSIFARLCRAYNPDDRRVCRHRAPPPPLCANIAAAPNSITAIHSTNLHFVILQFQLRNYFPSRLPGTHFPILPNLSLRFLI